VPTCNLHHQSANRYKRQASWHHKTLPIDLHEWETTQSLAVIAGCAACSALIGYFFLALVFGASTGVGTLNDDQEEEHGPVVRDTTGIGAERGSDGD
jgi:hypothetical protein